MRYFLYARKSTDTEDKQVLSIEAQLAELRALAKREKLEIVHEFVEKQSAKMPGRPLFDEMMKRIQKGEATGIVCWKLDRLARNPVDGGQIQWFLQKEIIGHILTHDRSYYPSDNVLMMSVEFGMANQYIRDLSVNVARGLRAKARRGEFPSTAPIGYLNDPRTKTIVVDRKKSKLVRAAFELYAEGESRLEDIANYFLAHGIKSKAGNPLHRDVITFILENPFYYGTFLFKGELYEGRHTPLISKKLFNKVQRILVERGHPQPEKFKAEPLCGLIRCGECGMHITAERKQKRQQNGNVHDYVYYRCTKKFGNCDQRYIRDTALVPQINELLAMFVLPAHWAADFERMMEADKHEADKTASASIHVLRGKAHEITRTLDRLMDLYIAQDIERGAYLDKRRALVSEKATLDEQIATLERDAQSWLEPLQNWITEAQNLNQVSKDPSLPAKKSALRKIFGSDLLLRNQELSGTAHPLYAGLVRLESTLTFAERAREEFKNGVLPREGKFLRLWGRNTSSKTGQSIFKRKNHSLCFKKWFPRTIV
jgi:DNA invertase Pin-like site-specific DNA recombinase